MRKTFFFMIALGTFAFIAAPALAGSLVLSKVYSKEELKTACDKNGSSHRPLIPLDWKWMLLIFKGTSGVELYGRTYAHPITGC